jgi:hypothetical protein
VRYLRHADVGIGEHRLQKYLLVYAGYWIFPAMLATLVAGINCEVVSKTAVSRTGREGEFPPRRPC